ALLTRREHNPTVTLTHTGTRNPDELLPQADVIVAAAGSAGIVTAEAVKPGAIVLDVGGSRETDPETGKSKIVGEVDPAVAEVAAWVSPNPGGAGPMTRALLLKTVDDTCVGAVRRADGDDRGRCAGRFGARDASAGP